MACNWLPCRKCGKTHKNPRSSSICHECGRAESLARIDAEERERARMDATKYQLSAFSQFMAMSDDEKWEWVFDRLSGKPS